MVFIGCVSIFLFSFSLYLFSKSAHIRAKTRTESLYAFQLNQQIQQDFLINGESLIVDSKTQEEIEILDPTMLQVADKEEHHEIGGQDTKLELIELDEKANNFLQKVIGKKVSHMTENYVQEELEWDNSTMEGKESWFNFKETNLLLCERPDNGLFFVAAKIMEKYDDLTVILSDGTDERMFEHKKFVEHNVGDIFIGQVKISNRQWTLINIWKINQEKISTSEEVA